MKIVICGGHFSPALAVIDQLKGNEILFIGRKFAMEGDSSLSFEYKTITSLGIPFKAITTARLQRKLTKFTLRSLLKFPNGLSQAFSILKEFKPDVILGFGGYISLPVILAASLLRIPVVIHEQTTEAGMANKIASKFAKKICISWPSSENYFPKSKTVLTGNPLRKEILEMKNKKTKNQMFTIYVTGGSLGSHFINELIEKNLKELLEKYYIIHQAGDSKYYNDFEKLKSLSVNLDKNLSEKYILAKYFTPKQSAQNLSKSDLVISRSGMNTITELYFLQKPAFLIPIPFTQKNEQFKNALILKKAGLAQIYEQSYLTPKTFLLELEKMIHNIKKYKVSFLENQKNDSAKAIVKVLNDVATKKKN